LLIIRSDHEGRSAPDFDAVFNPMFSQKIDEAGRLTKIESEGDNLESF
jgi:hypothetical protein